MLADREAFMSEVRTRLLQAQEYARRHYNAHHRDVEFAVGDWVWLRILTQTSAVTHSRQQGEALTTLCWSILGAGTRGHSGVSPASSRGSPHS